MAGRQRQAQEQADRAPWAQYLAIRGARTRPGHAALHGQVFRLDSPAWAVIAPPNGYNCRCRARYLSDRELAARGLKPATDVRVLERAPPGKRPADPLTGETPARWLQRGVSVPDPFNPNQRLTLWADQNWDHLPGSIGAERKLVDRMIRQADAVGDGVRELILADMARRGADFVRAAMASGAPKTEAYLLSPGVPELARLAAAAVDVPGLSGLALALSHDRVRHIMAGHGPEAMESARGQRAINPEDFAALPAVLEGATSVEQGTPSTTPSGSQLIRVRAQRGGELWEIVLEVQRKQRLLVPYTLWIR